MANAVAPAPAPPQPLAPHLPPGCNKDAASPWFMLAALLTVAGAAEEGLKQQRDGAGACTAQAGGAWLACPTRSRHQLWTSSRPGPPTPTTSSPTQAHVPAARPDPGAMYACNQRYRRQISSATDMRFLHIPRDMAEALIPDVMAYQISRPGRKKATVRMGTAGRPVFAARVSIIDHDGRTWPVLFRTYVTGKQYHRRLTDGWRPFAAHHGLTAGDAVHFWRRPEDECVDALVMRVQVVRGMLR